MKFKRLVTIMLTLSVAVSLVAFPVAAVDYSDVVAPLYIGLEDATAILLLAVMATRIAADQLMSRTAITQLL